MSFEPLSIFVSDDPILRMQQGLLLLVAFVLLFLIFFTLRDVLLRTRSTAAQIGAILLVTLLPIVGFLVYLLVRPSRTIAERELDEAIKKLLP